MKWTSIILSILFLMLSCMPCADMGVSNFTRAKAELLSAENHAHSKGTDLCSPFCVCNCCGSLVTSYQQSAIFDFSIVFKEIEKQLPAYKSVFSSNFHGSIWQPPQLV